MVCHTEPVNNPPIPGPLSIYTYDLMRAKLMNGNNGTDNELIRKVQMIPTHAGGNRCPGGLNDVICMQLQEWYNRELPNPVPPPAPNPQGNGAISDIDSRGKITAGAANPADPTMTVNVKFYVDDQSVQVFSLVKLLPIKLVSTAVYPGQHAYDQSTFLLRIAMVSSIKLTALPEVNGQDDILASTQVHSQKKMCTPSHPEALRGNGISDNNVATFYF